MIEGGIPDNHRSIEAPNSKFPRYQWVETRILPRSLHKAHYYLLLSRSKFTTQLTAFMRTSKIDLVAIVAYSAYSGTRTECQNNRVHVTKQF